MFLKIPFTKFIVFTQPFYTWGFARGYIGTYFSLGKLVFGREFFGHREVGHG